MSGRAFSQNPRKRGKKHYHHRFISPGRVANWWLRDRLAQALVFLVFL